MRKTIPVRAVDLGQIEIKNGKIQMSDPCYSPDLWCSHVTKVKNGKWNCKALVGIVPHGWGQRVVALEINHESTPKKKATTLQAVCPVDSGQCGFFDADYYNKQYQNADVNEKWYNKICKITCDDDNDCCGAIDGQGVVAASGIGDGVYDCYVGHNTSGEVTAMRLKFI